MHDLSHPSVHKHKDKNLPDNSLFPVYKMKRNSAAKEIILSPFSLHMTLQMPVKVHQVLGFSTYKPMSAAWFNQIIIFEYKLPPNTPI